MTTELICSLCGKRCIACFCADCKKRARGPRKEGRGMSVCCHVARKQVLIRKLETVNNPVATQCTIH